MNKRGIMIMAFAFLLPVTITQAALTVDRSRFIYNEGDRSVSVTVTNKNGKLPYLAQAWIENISGDKISEPLIVIPPLQRVEAGAQTKLRIQTVSNLLSLPNNQESLFYFNLREIPPKGDAKNSLTLAMQSRLKIFYRPKGLKVNPMLNTVPGTDRLILVKNGSELNLKNTTPYYFTIVGLKPGDNESSSPIEPMMIEPNSTGALNITSTEAGNSPTLLFINDYGSQMKVSFSCASSVCKVIPGSISMDV